MSDRLFGVPLRRRKIRITKWDLALGGAFLAIVRYGTRANNTHYKRLGEREKKAVRK